MQVLHIIEDNKLYQTFLQKHLQKKFSIKVYESVESWEKDKTKDQPDFLIVDYNLPGKNGFEFVMKEKEKLSETKFILLSANKDGRLVLDLIRKGIRNYVIKDEEVIENICQTIADNTYQY